MIAVSPGTVATLYSIPAASTLTWNVSVRLSPAAIDGTDHKLMGCPAVNDVPAGMVAELGRYVPPALSESLTIVVASVVPRFFRIIVYVSTSPGTALEALTYFCKDSEALAGTT